MNPARLSSVPAPDLRAYWEDRAGKFARRSGGLPAVCSYGMPWFYNKSIHLSQWLALRRWLRIRPGARVLDLGCGVGRWSVELARRGGQVTGVDWSERMLEEARRRAHEAGMDSRCRFVAQDLTTLALDQTYDLILCVTVLQHILEPERFESTWARLVGHLAPGGRIVLLEVAPDADNPRCNTPIFRARTAETYHRLARQWHLHREAVTGVDPAPFKLWLLPHLKGLPRWAGRTALAAATLASLPIDAVLGRRMVGASWHKVFVFNQPAGNADPAPTRSRSASTTAGGIVP